MMWRLRLIVLGVVGLLACGLASRAMAEPHFLDGETLFDGLFPAEAVLTVETPIGFVTAPGPTFGDPIYGVGPAAVFHTFTVTGNIRIRSSAAQNSYVDAFSGPIGPVDAGNHVVQQEIVDVTDVVITSPTAGAGTLRLGDTVSDFLDSGALPGEPRSLFSTGGSAEISPGFTSADGYLNLFLEVNVTNPDIVTPIGSFDIGQLHNEVPLHLEAVHTEYLPFGLPFFMANISGPEAPLNPVPMFTRTTHPFAVAVGIVSGQPPQQQEFARFVGAQITIIGTPVPEASSIILGGFGLLGFAGYVWRLRRRASV